MEEVACSVSKECDTCDEEFNQNERCPRSLPCSHSLCHQCIEELIVEGDKNCPVCQESFEAASAQDFMVITASLDLLKVWSRSPAGGPGTPRTRNLEELKKQNEVINNKNIDLCTKAEGQIKASMKNNEHLKSKVVESHRVAKEELKRKIKDLEERSKLKLKYLDEESDGLEGQLKEVREQKEQLDIVKNDLDEAITLPAVDAAVIEVEQTDAAVQSWLREFKKSKSRQQKSFRKFKKNVQDAEEKMNVICETLDAVEDEENKLIENLEKITLHESNQGKLTLETLKALNPTTKYFLGVRGVYAVHQHEGQRRCAKISFTEDKVLLHCLTDEKLPINAYTIDYQDTMSIIDPASRRTFLEFGSCKSTLGTVFILSPDSKRALNFSLLCMGQKGQSYLGTCIHKVEWKGSAGECIHSGDYEKGTGDGGRTLVPGAGDETGGVLTQKNLAGSVSGRCDGGDPKGGQFDITVKENPNLTLHKVFGKVESGLDILVKAIDQFPNIKEVKITDCGAVLPL